MLNIDLEYKRGILFLRLDGILNKNTNFILEDALKNVLYKAGIRYLLINFEKLNEIDQRGIETIINSYHLYLENYGKLMICGYNDKIRMNIEKSNLLKYAFNISNEISAFNIINI